jgi:hypothetical protein
VKTPVVRVNPVAGKATAPAGAAATAPKAPVNSKVLYGGIGGGVAVVALLVALVIWKPWKVEPPRLNDEPWKIAEFVSTTTYGKLPFERQLTYMDVLDDKEDAIAQAYNEHKLDDQQYAAALQAAYLGKHLKRAKNYAEKATPRAREAYLDKVIEKKKKNDNEKPKSKGTTTPVDAEEIKRDDSEEQDTINRWPSDAQAQWTGYRMALKARKDYLKEQKEKREAAATQAAAPGKTK